MFKLLAIRPLYGCAPHIHKCLKTDLMYYFCNDYIIDPNSHIRRKSRNLKPLKEDFFSIDYSIDYEEDIGYTKCNNPKVNVSAVVGMNGDGKSSLMEMMMRLVNNCAISYKLCGSPDNLKRVKNVKAELYYIVDDIVYRMAEESKQEETWIWKVAELKRDSNGGELMRWKMEPKIIRFEDDPNAFFFTIVSNYSHYAYNVYDYEKEWDIRGGEKSDDEKCWLHYIFHKNDGYLTPITIHPFRSKGNIEINNEQYLSKQRLLSLFLDADNPSDNPHSFRRVNGKDANILKLIEEKSSKLQQKSIIEYFERTDQTNKFRDLLEEIYMVNDDAFQTSLIMDSDDEYNKYYNSLVYSLLPSLFLKPLNQIIEQDEQFHIFANEVVNWAKTKNKNRKVKNDGDIITILRRCENQFYRNETYIQLGECSQNAKNHIKAGNNYLALDHYKKAMEISKSQLGEEHIFTALVYNDIAVVYENLGEYEKALEYYEKAITLKELKLSKDHLSIAITYDNVAGVRRAMGEKDKALDYCERAMGIIGSKSDPLLLAKTYNNIALLYGDLGSYGEALDYIFNAIQIRENVLGKDHIDTVITYGNTAGIYAAKGERNHAIKYYERVLSKMIQLVDTEHEYVASTYDNLAWVHYSDGALDKALFFYTKALKIKQKNLGPEHLDLVVSYDNIAWVSYDKREYEKTLDLFLKSLRIRKNVLGETHLDTIQSYNNIAGVYYCLEDFDNALRYYKQALSKMEKLPNKRPLDIATTYNNTANICVLKNFLEEALSYYERAKKIKENVLGKNHLDTAITYNNMALAYMFNEDYDSALTFFSKALKARKDNLNKKHPRNCLDTAAIYDNMAFVFKIKDNHNKALENYSQALLIREDVLGKRNLDTALSYSKVAWEYYSTVNYEKALEYFLKVLETREEVLGTEHIDTLQYYNIVAGVLKNMGNYEKAWEYYNKALKRKDFIKDKSIPDANTIKNMIPDACYDDNIEDKENYDFIKQLCPENKRSKTLPWKGKMDKILECKDRMEKMTQNKDKELIDTDKFKFLDSINSTQLGRLDTLYRIIKKLNQIDFDINVDFTIDFGVVTKSYSKLSLKEKCQHYIVYKTLSILSNYPQYQKAFTKDATESLNECGFALEECVEEIISDSQSHITRKIRQVKNFINEGLEKGGLYERLRTKGKKSGVFLVEIDELKKHYRDKTFSLDNLPPPLYRWDIIFNKKDEPDRIIEFDSFSSGEKQMLNSIGSIIYHLQNLANTAPGVCYHNVNLIMEEIELYYHPEYQRLFFSRLLDLIKRSKLGIIQNINVVFVTHSPFILSDIPKCNVLFLKDGMPKDIMQENTFGANIHSLLKNGFFMPNLPIGEFAYEKINKLFRKLNSGDLNPEKDLIDIYQEILLVGEPFLRNQLLMLYNSYKGNRQITYNQ